MTSKKEPGIKIKVGRVEVIAVPQITQTTVGGTDNGQKQENHDICRGKGSKGFRGKEELGFAHF